jgi:multidrug resistance efflux pump
MGEPLFELDPEPYDIALARARSDYATVLSAVKANGESVVAAKAGLQAAATAYQNAAKDAERQERLYREDPGTISVRRLEIAQATRKPPVVRWPPPPTCVVPSKPPVQPATIILSC